MRATLLEGDFLIVSKMEYGYSRHSLPFSPPLWDGRVFGGEPERGDVVVFKTPQDNRTDYIKRLIGLPGDEVQVRNGILHLNGAPVERERLEDFIETDARGNIRRVARYRETLPGGASYTILDRTPHGEQDNTGIFVVPEGHYFMMGDNRDQSVDSRFMYQVGYVPEENLVGEAKVLFFSAWGSPFWQFWNWPSAIRWERIFDSVD
jgi:signal peptidase I